MKKIPTLFVREFENHRVKRILPEVTPGFEWVLEGDGIATIKFDGAACAIIDGQLYRRFDAKPGRTVPEGAIPCCEPDAVTGHHPHWVKCVEGDPESKWFFVARDSYPLKLEDGTYEAIGRHFNGNPYKMTGDTLVKHGESVIEHGEFARSFEGIKAFLEKTYIEGIVFWKDGEPQCKIKRSDFGFEWNGRKQK